MVVILCRKVKEDISNRQMFVQRPEGSQRTTHAAAWERDAPRYVNVLHSSLSKGNNLHRFITINHIPDLFGFHQFLH